ncbi:MAG: hypothetical protein ACI8PZ_005205, partial [Myxococcota bacterium]
STTTTTRSIVVASAGDAPRSGTKRGQMVSTYRSPNPRAVAGVTDGRREGGG